MADRIAITAAPRSILGKGVRRLRREGGIPANVFGRGIASTAIQLEGRDFLRTLKQHGARGLFDLSIEGEAQTRPVIVRAITRKGGTGDPIHIDFYQVDPRRPIQATVAIRMVGEAPAVRDLAGTLLPSIDQVTVRCAPLDIPEALEVSLARLVGFDVTLTVGDIVPIPGVEIVTDPSVVIATVAAPRIRLDAAAGGEEGEVGETAPTGDEGEADAS